MDFLNRSKNRLYKAYKEFSVEYHAGGFFIRKKAMYIFFNDNDSLIVLEKNEGLHPFDNEYSKLLPEDILKGQTFRLSRVTNSIVIFSDGVNEIKIMPSVFSENYSDKKVTELFIDFGNDHNNIFFFVDISESHQT